MSHRKALLTFGLLFAATGFTASQRQSKTPEPKPAQVTSGDDKGIHEMLLTEAGLLAFDTPKDWERSEGPGFACFVPKKFWRTKINRDDLHQWSTDWIRSGRQR
jgi:hypothetical protein